MHSQTMLSSSRTMSAKVIVSVALLVVVSADTLYRATPYQPPYGPYKSTPYSHDPYKPATYKPAPYKPAPYKPAPYQPAYKPSYKPDHYDDYSDEPTAYAFGYAVSDHYTGTNFGHQEERDGYATKGSYKVNLPDGRVQIVSYVADDNGYNAEVTYEGEAHHDPAYSPKPAYHPQPYAPKPAPYKPAYKPAYTPTYTPVYGSYRPGPAYV